MLCCQLVLPVNSLKSVLVLISLFQKLEQTDTLTHVVRTDAPEMIPHHNLLMVNQIVVIASVAASAKDVLYFIPLSISIDFNVKDTEILK